MDCSIDGRIVRTVRSLRKFQTTIGSFSTRASTPSNENQLIDLINSREELASLRQSLTASEIFEIIKPDKSILRFLILEPNLTEAQVLKIQQKIQEFFETKKIQEAKLAVNKKLEERLENLKKMLADSVE